MFDCCLVSSLSLMYFTIFYFHCFPLAGLRLRFFWYVFPQDRQLLGCFFGRWFLIIPCTFSFCSDLATRSGCSFSLQVCSLLATHLPLRQVFFWPAILTPRCPVSGTPLPLRHDFFWPAILTPRSPFSGTPGPSFHSLFWCPWSSVSTPSFFPTQPSLPGYLGGRLALCAALRFACGFYRSAVFTTPRFLSLRFHQFFGGSALPPPSCLLPPSLHPLPGGSLFVPPCGTPAIFTAPRFLPLRGFYRSAVFTAPLSPGFWGLCSSAALLLAAPQSSSSSGRTLWCRLVRSVSGGPPFLTLFCAACLTTLGALPLISPVSLLCISYKLGDRRSSRLLSVGTRAPRVLPPPSGTSRRMEIRHFHHRLTEVPSVDMLIEAWNGSIYRWHGVSLWCGFLHIPQIHAPPVPETR